MPVSIEIMQWFPGVTSPVRVDGKANLCVIHAGQKWGFDITARDANQAAYSSYSRSSFKKSIPTMNPGTASGCLPRILTFSR